MYKVLQHNISTHPQTLQNLQKKLQKQVTAEMQPTATYWTIYDELYAISINKK